MKKQICVRTFPNTYTNPTMKINKYLNLGYTVVMCNSFAVNDTCKGNEYILESVEDNSANYCRLCGQLLDWGDTE